MANRIKESNITPGAVTSDKIAPGTVSASNISPGTITNTLIAPGTIANDRLANTGITINGTTIALGASGSIVAGTDWQAVITADGSTSTTAVAGEGYFIDTTSATHTINLPSSPTQGDEVHIVDYAGTFGTNNVTVGRNSSNIDGSASDATLATNRLNVRFVYVDSTVGWTAVFDKASSQYGATFISATGGTITTSGDYKIHTFTGDGCFVVSQVGNPAGSTAVDYLVVAGGGSSATGGGNSGGGGGGGYRESHSVPVSGCYTASPLATPTGITVTATTYPITVGGGGAAGSSPAPANPKGNPGSNSVFATITSTGGGGAAGNDSSTPAATGLPGGSGGGAGGGGATPVHPAPGGAGNTPPVAPPQGNPGGATANTASPIAGAGGGGASAAGSDNGASAGGNGGNGATTSISGSPTTYAGGGGGAADGGGPHGTGGSGGGGNGGNPTGTAGSANTGGGAGGAACDVSNPSLGGGKGIVIIRYKYQ